MPQIIFFDLCDVLVTDPMDSWYASVKQSHGLERLEAYHKVKDLFDDLEEGRLDEHTYWSRVGERMGAEWPKQESWRLMSYADLRMLEGAKEVLFELIQKGVRIGIISNTSREWGAHFMSKVLPRAWFNPVILSCNVQKKKPHVAIFEEAAKAVGSPSASDLLFLDDRQKHVDAAKSLGWDAEVVTNSEEIKAALQKRGLL